MTQSRCRRPEVMVVSRCPVDPATLSCRSRAAAMMVLVFMLVPACSIGTAQEADEGLAALAGKLDRQTRRG